MRLEDKVVLITGASTGIGKATALALSRRGAHVVIGYHSSPRGARATEKDCSRHADAGIVKLDIRSDTSMRRALAFVTRRFGRLDVLVNNAGVGYFNPFVKLTRKMIGEMLDVNIMGTMMMTKLALPLIKKRKEAVIINIGSMAGYHVWADGTVYCPTKWAVRGFSQALALELPGRIRIHTVNPDLTATSMGNWQGDDPRDVAEVIANAIAGTYRKKSGADIDVPDFIARR